MTETHDDSLQINILLDPVPAQLAGFDSGLIIADAANNSSGQVVKSYEDAESVDSDWTSTEKDAADAYFGQEESPQTLLVGEWDQSGSDDLTDALDNILAVDNGFYTIATITRTDAETEVLSADLESRATPLQYFLQSSSDDIVTGTTLPTDFGSDFDTRERTIPDYHTTDTEFMDVAHMARILTPDPDRNSAPYFADVDGVADYSGLPSGASIGSQQSPGNARENNFNVMLPFRQEPAWIAPGTNAAGRQGKVILTRDWFEDRLQQKVANVILSLRKDNRGLPVGEAGTQRTTGQVTMASQITAQYNEGVRAGHFLPGNLDIGFPVVQQSDVDNGIIPLDATMTVAIFGQAVTFDINFQRSPIDG